MICPSGMAADGDRLLVCDPGQPTAAAMEPYWVRVRPHMFTVVVHFAASRLPDETTDRARVLREAVNDVVSVVDTQKPAHTVWKLITAIH